MSTHSIRAKKKKHFGANTSTQGRTSFDQVIILKTMTPRIYEYSQYPSEKEEALW